MSTIAWSHAHGFASIVIYPLARNNPKYVRLHLQALGLKGGIVHILGAPGIRGVACEVNANALGAEGSRRRPQERGTKDLALC